MPCGGCMGARTQFVQSARTYNVRGMAGAVRQAIHINVDKVRSAYRASQPSPVAQAKPYRRPPERTT